MTLASEETAGFLHDSMVAEVRRVLQMAEDLKTVSTRLLSALGEQLEPPDRPMSMPLVLSETAAFYDLPEDLIRFGGRSRDLIRPRHVAMYLCRELTDFSYPTIGRWFSMDHTTVMHAVTSVTVRLREDRTLKAEVSLLQSRITSMSSGVS